ncbi:meiotic recombination protein REC8 [Pseudohyphozyma bogoriensis]|nr:meiotic recombination protein REC8 [Pseudohyphozyma bogoriensis]
MFYSTEILTRRKNGFGIYWLAATLGSKGGSSFKKLTRKEVLGCDIAGACEKLIAPDEPLALRLSSNLLCGIARVYQQQFTFFSSDVTQMHASLKKSFAEIYSKKEGHTSIELAPHAHGAANVNLIADPVDQHVGLFDFDWDIGFDWDAGGGGIKLFKAGAGDTLLDLGSRDGTPLLDVGSQAVRRRAYQARDADISLQEHHLDAYQRNDDRHVFDEPLGDFEIEGEGLLMGHSEELDAVLRQVDAENSVRAGSGRGGRKGGGVSSSAEGAVEFQLGDDFGDGGYGDNVDPSAGMNYGEAYGTGERGDPDETASQRVQRERDEAEAQKSGVNALAAFEDEIDFDGDFGLGSDAAEEGKKRKSSEEPPQPPTKAKKRKTITIDSVINLTDEQCREMRLNYSDKMEAERMKLKRVKEKKDALAKFSVDSLRPPIDHPVFSQFWDKVVVSQQRPLGGGAAKTQTKKASRNGKAGGKQGDGGAAELGLAGAGLDNRELSFQFDDFGGGGDDQNGVRYNFGDDFGGMDMIDLDQNQDELGRAGSQAKSASQRNAHLPWNAAAYATSDLGGVDLGGFGSSQAGTGKKLSLDTPARAGAKGKGRASSQVGADTPQAGSLAGFEGGVGEEGEDYVGDASSVVDPAVAIGTLERESLNFLAYTKDQADSQDEELFFSDIVPVASTDQSAAAQAFYHLLVLANKSLLKVKQTEAYGDIVVTVAV